MQEQLSIEVCRICHKKAMEDPCNPRGADWDFNDRQQWFELHTVLCFVDIQKSNRNNGDLCYKTASVYEPPPEWCPYKFQHAVALGREL